MINFSKLRSSSVSKESLEEQFKQDENKAYLKLLNDAKHELNITLKTVPEKRMNQFGEIQYSFMAVSNNKELKVDFVFPNDYKDTRLIEFENSKFLKDIYLKQNEDNNFSESISDLGLKVDLKVKGNWKIDKNRAGEKFFRFQAIELNEIKKIQEKEISR